MVLHGCLQSAEVLGEEFYTKIGVNEWADTNRIVVLYPQAHATSVSELSSQDFLSLFNTNLQGCWNWCTLMSRRRTAFHLWTPRAANSANAPICRTGRSCRFLWQCLGQTTQLDFRELQ